MGIALFFWVRRRNRAWILLSLFAGVFFLGDLYWLLYLVFYDSTPLYSYVSDLSWDASYLFLMILLILIREDNGLRHWDNRHRRCFWIVPVFTVGMCVFYMQRGDFVTNIVVAILMTGLIWHALDGLLFLRSAQGDSGSRRMLYLVTLLFCFAEYGLWTSSCFWAGDAIVNVYFWFDFLLSFTFLLFLPALRKAVEG